MDRIYTPAAVARALAEAAAVTPDLVADFTAGEGALLAAARDRWPEARLAAVDVDGAAVEGLKARFPDADCREADFLLADAELEPLVGAVDLVLLNPPFSCRGSTRHPAVVGGSALTCSRAMAFVARSLTYLAPGGELLCILPASCLMSDKDAAARAAIGQTYRVEIIDPALPSVFGGHSVVVAQVRIARQAPAGGAWAPAAAAGQGRNGMTVMIGRGSLPVHVALAASPGGRDLFVHTTHLVDGTCRHGERRLDRRADLDAAPAVLLPRVGRPARAKVALVQGEPLVLSDCVVWMRSEPGGRETELRDLLLSRWDEVAALYGGSCAPYTSLDRLSAFLAGCGMVVRRRAPAAGPNHAEPRV